MQENNSAIDVPKNRRYNYQTMIIRITDPPGYGTAVSESFLENRFDVVSRSGLHITETHLINALPTLSHPARMLILGNRTGTLGMIANRFHDDLAVVVSSLDIFHHHAIERNLARNPFISVTARCEPDIPERDLFDTVCLQLSAGGMADELILDLLQQSHLALRKDGTLMVAAEEDIPWLAEHMKKSFGTCSLRGTEQTSTLLVSRKKKELKKLKDYRAEFTMTTPGGKAVQLVTRPGVFAHRRVDEGAQALAEVALTKPGDTILDMGCGCGSIGLTLAVNQPSARVCFVDSHSRAVQATEQNCRANGLTDYKVILNDEGPPPDMGGFTLFVGNPPYYSNDRISDFFIQTAYKSLLSGGRAYVVGKKAAHNAEMMKALFGNSEIIHRRGYEIAKSVKS